MALFLSTFINKLDKKGRVSVPAPFRQRLLGQSFQGIVAFASLHLPTIEGMGIERVEQLSASMDAFDPFGRTEEDLTAALFSDVHMLPFDGDGRILLPRILLDHARISDAVAFVGRGPTFRIWHPDLFASHQAESRKRMRILDGDVHA